MNYFVFKNSFLSSADKKGHELPVKPKYSESLNMISNSAGPQINSVLPEEKNCKRWTKSAVNKCGSADSHGKTGELEQKESYVVPKSRRNLTSSSRKRDDSTSSQEYGTEYERNKSTRKNSREQNKGPQVRMLDLHQSARPKIVVKIPPDEFRNESEKLKREYSRNEPGAGPESETSSKTQDKVLMKGQEIEEMPCGESGKWKYIRMYQERNRKREERLRRKRQKEKEEARGSGKRRRSTRKRRKSKKRSKSRSRRKSRGRRSKSRRKSRRRNSTSSRGSSRSRSRRRSSRRNRR